MTAQSMVAEVRLYSKNTRKWFCYPQSGLADLSYPANCHCNFT